MAEVEILLPAMGEGIIEATLTKILSPVGTKVDEEDSIVEVATDKVDSEVPCSESGIVTEIRYAEGDVVPIGGIIAIIQTEAKEEAITPSAAAATPVQVEVAPLQTLEADIQQTIEQTTVTSETQGPLSPLVRSIAQKENVSADQLASIQGTGQHGRVTKDDLLQYLQNRTAPVVEPSVAAVSSIAQPAIQPKQPAAQVKEPTTPTVAAPGTELIEMDRMRRLISDHMLHSKQVSPHVSSFVEVDMTKIVHWRNKHKAEFQQKYGQKLTFTPLFVEAAAQALRDFPMVNVSVDGYTIVKKNFINVGMATALPSGNLIVPVIKDADQRNLAGLAAQVNDLAVRARNNKLKPDEIQGSTFTITNVGSFGNITGTPIINQPEVAILAVGVIAKKPAVIETPEGDTIGIRHQMIMALSYDHRVVDGALGGMFLKRIADYLEGFDNTRTV